MYKLFFSSFASLLTAFFLCSTGLNTYHSTSLLACAFLVNETIASLTEQTSSVFVQYRQLKTNKVGYSISENGSIALSCPRSSGRPASSDCRTTTLLAGSGNSSLKTSDPMNIPTKTSHTQDTSLSEWQNSLRSKPGTASSAGRKIPSFNIIDAITVSDSPIERPQPSSLVTRFTSAQNTVVIYETSTDCKFSHSSSSLRTASGRSSPSRPVIPSFIIKASSGTSTANSNGSSTDSTNLRPLSIKNIMVASGRAHQDQSTKSKVTEKGLSRTSGSVTLTYQYPGVVSIRTVPRSSGMPISSQLPVETSSLQISSVGSSPSLMGSSVRSYPTASGLTKLTSNNFTSLPVSVKVGNAKTLHSHLNTSRASSKASASLSSCTLSYNRTTSTAWSEATNLHEKLSPSRPNLSSGGTTSTASFRTSNSYSLSSSSRATSMRSRSFDESSGSSTVQNSSQPSPQASSILSSNLASTVTIPLTTCAVTSQRYPATTSWMTGACKLTSLDDPISTLKCASSMITPLPVTACACPDGQYYEQMAGGVGPCHDYTSIGASEFLEPILTCTDLPTSCIPRSTSATPTSTPPPIPYGGHFILIPAYPSTCNATTITYSSTKPLATGQIMIDSSIGWGNANSQWKFRAGGGVTIERMNNTSNPGTSIFSGNWEPSSEDFTKNADGSWTMTVVPNMPSLSLFAVTSGGTTNKSFPFTVTSVIPCDKPVALQCNNSFSDLTQNQCVAFEVDKFVTMIEKEFQATKGPNFFGWFLDQYVGDTIKAPCQIDQEGCQPLSDPCTFVKPGPYQRQAFFVVSAMITLSRYIRYAWLAYERSRGDLLSELAAWTTAFIVPQRTQTWQNIVAITASVFGILSVIGFAAGPFMPLTAAIFTPLFVGAVSSGLFGVNSLLNTAINAADVNGAALAEQVRFDGYAKADQAMNAYINASEQALIDTNNAYFLHGTNLSQVLQGGLFVANTPIAELTDGDFSGAVTAAADWFDKTMIWSLINEAWKSDDNYIVFLPYGPVKWYSGETKQFTVQMCQDQFLGNNHWNGTIYGSCDAGPPDHPGFASFMTAQKLMDFNEYNKKSYYEVSYSYQNYKFNADDVLRSSIAGYYQSGYNYNATSIPIGQLLTEQNQQPVAQYVNQTADSPGIFNVPVCIISDTSYVPACTISNWGDRGDPCYTSPKQCLESKWIDPKDPTQVQNFTSYVSQNVVSGLQDATTYGNL